MQSIRGTTDKESSNNIGQFVSMLTILKLDQPISIAAVARDYIAIYGASSGQEGAFLILYNTKYQIVQTKQFFKIYFNNSRIWVIGNNIFLGVGQMLSVVPFRISKEQLSDRIGSQVTNDFDNYVGKDFINEESEFEECLTFDDNLQNNLNTNQYNGGKIDDYNEIDNKIDLTQNFRELYNFDILIETIRSEIKSNEQIGTKLYTNPNDDLIMNEEFEIFALELEKCGACEIEITEKLIPAMIEANSIYDLLLCLKKYSNISEKMLVKSLAYALSLIDTNIDDIPLKDLKLLHQILSCSYNRDEILPHLRSKINITSTIFLLKYLLKLYKSDEIIINSDNNQMYDDHDEIILNWISLIIDSQYQNLILSSDNTVLEIFNNYQKIINASILSLKEMENFLPKLHNLVNKKKFDKQDKYSKWYSIEKVKLY